MATPQQQHQPHSHSQSRPLQDRVAIVTGSSRGIGREIAIHLASLGARVVVNYTSNSALADSLAAQINFDAAAAAAGAPTRRAIAVRGDVSDSNDVKALFDSAERAFGSAVHILVNSAAVTDSKHQTIANIAVEDFDRIFRYFNCFSSAVKLKMCNKLLSL